MQTQSIKYMICISLCLATTQIFTIKHKVIDTTKSYKSQQYSKLTHFDNNFKVLMCKLDKLEKAEELYNQKNKNKKITTKII